MRSAETLSDQGASAAAIQSHYDIGNDFYRLWLDRDLNYSAALWEAGDTLDSSQLRKVDFHINQSGAVGADCVLDIGCGWGSVLRRMIQHWGVKKVVGLTLSNAQAEWIDSLKMAEVEVRVESWFDHEPEGQYNAIISIGAFEHFAKLTASDEQKVLGYRRFFERCRDWLPPKGRLSLQTFAYGGIRSREDVRRSTGTRYLSSEIFPETDPPRLADIANAAEGIFEIVRLSNDRKDYARTLREWLARLRANRQKAVTSVGEEVFLRFDRYLQLSLIGFETGHLALYRITFVSMK